MASGGAEAVSDPLKSKTVVLKVPIHCPGCKKKVQRIVKRIDGVSTCEVDAVHNKVTVTGDVDADSLIKKLLKSGKQADLWPEPKKQKPPTTTAAAAPAPAPHNPNPTQKKEPDDARKETSEKSEKNKNPSETPKEIADTKAAAKEPPKPKKSAEEEEKEDPKPNQSKAESSAEAPPRKDPSEEEASSTKKEKKGQNHNNSADKREADSAPAPPDVRVHQMYLPPPPPPDYVVSYNTAQPTASHAYYAAAPVPHTSQPQGYAYAPYYYPAPPLPLEDLYYGPPGSRLSSPPPEDHYEYAVFNDENANSCNVM